MAGVVWLGWSLAAVAVVAAAPADPFALVASCVSVSAADRRAVDRGAVVARTQPGKAGQIALFAAARVDTTPDRMVEHARAIADLKKSAFVSSVRRFSDPPVLTDLDELVLGPRDLAAIVRCRAGDCSFKLTAAEIGLLDAERAGIGADRDRLLRAFRRVLLHRVTSYRAGGLGSLPPIANRPSAQALDQTLAALLVESPCLLQSPPLDAWLRHFPADGQHLESFLYWSQEIYSDGRPVILVTHVAIRRDGESAIVVGKQIFASRYMDGGIAMTAVTTDPASGRRYLIYLNRTAVDLIGGVLGPVKRAVVESRLRSRVPAIISELRARLAREPARRAR